MSEKGMEEGVVEVYSNWGYWDYLDGVELKDGEPIDVYHKDRLWREHRVCIDVQDRDGLDHGKSYNTPDRRAYVVGDLWGEKVRVYIKGLTAKRRL